MKNSVPLILAIGMAIAATGLYAWDRDAGAPNGRVVWAQDDPVVSVSQTKPVASPVREIRITEFILEGGTPCVMVWAPGRAQSSGISCDWQYRKTE